MKEIEDGTSVVEILRAKGIYNKWKRKYSGMETGDVKYMREFEKENAKSFMLDGISQ